MKKNRKLYNFIKRASRATYAGGGKGEKKPERKEFVELVYKEGGLEYRDSYTGYIRSRGMELVRKKGMPVWSSLYGGGMIKGKEQLAGETFDFLKNALGTKENEFTSFRGPRYLKDKDWEYKYKQRGDVNEFHGYEEIYHKGDLVFFHRVIGGIIISKK